VRQPPTSDRPGARHSPPGQSQHDQRAEGRTETGPRVTDQASTLDVGSHAMTAATTPTTSTLMRPISTASFSPASVSPPKTGRRKLNSPWRGVRFRQGWLPVPRPERGCLPWPWPWRRYGHSGSRSAPAHRAAGCLLHHGLDAFASDGAFPLHVPADEVARQWLVSAARRRSRRMRGFHVALLPPSPFPGHFARTSMARTFRGGRQRQGGCS